MDNFILYEPLSKGNSCILYKGRKKNTINFLAMKCADMFKKGEMANMVRLIHEIKHDNIVKFYEWYETAGHQWLMFELCTGGSLELLIQQDGNLPEDSIRKFGIDIAGGLYHIHSLDIIYSDLQPSKILVSGAGHLKLSDFGLSRLKNEDLNAVMTSLYNADEMEAKQTKQETYLYPDIPNSLKLSGNPKYMAPEVVYGGNHSCASDLWSFGCILYELFSGFPPFLGESFSELKEKILNSEPSEPNFFHGTPSDQFLDLIHGLLRKKPQSRMKWKHVLVHPFWNGALAHHLHFTTPLSSHENLKQSIRQSITNFRVVKEFGERTNDCGDDSADSDETVDGGDDTFRESALRPKEGNDDDICRNDISANCPALGKTKLCDQRQASTNSDDFKSDASVATITSTEIHKVSNLIFHCSDFQITSVANPKKERMKISNLKFDSKALPLIPADVENLSEKDTDDHVKTLVGLLLPILNHKNISAPQKLVQLLNYVGSISHKNPRISNQLISFKILSHLAKQSKDNSQIEMKFKLCQVIDVIVSSASYLDLDVDLSEVLSSLVDAAREHSTNQKLKIVYLATIGELLTLITKQEHEVKQVGVTWLVPPTVYSLINRCLAEGEDVLSSLYAARIIANVAIFKSNQTQRFLTTETCNNLWSMFLHGTSELIRIAAITALGRLSRHSLTLAVNLFEVHGMSQYLQTIISFTTNDIKQPAVTLLVLILTSDSCPSKWLMEKEPLSFLIKLLDSSTSVVRAKSYLGILEVITSSNDQLLHACQNKLLTTIERDLKRTSSDGEAKVSDYLYGCLKVLIGHLVGILPKVFNEVLSSFEVIQGKKHLTSIQQKHLKYSLSLLQIVQHFINSNTFRPKILSKSFLRNLSKLYEFLVVCQTSIFQLPSILGLPSYDEFIQTTFGCSEFIVLHCDIIDDHVDIIINNILSHLFSLVTCSTGDLKSMSLRFFCESCIMLLSDDKMLTKPQAKCLERLLDGFLLCMEQILIDASSSYQTLRLLKEIIERRPHFIRNLQQTNLAAALFRVVYSHHDDVTCSAVRQVIGILKFFIVSKETDVRHLFQLGFSQFLIFIFVESNLLQGITPPQQQDSHGGGDDDVPSRDGSRDQTLLEVLDLFHALMKRVSGVVRGALEAKKAGQKTSSDASEAKDLLILNKDFVVIMSPLARLLPHKDEEISEEALKCLGLLIQFYGGENDDSLSIENQIYYDEYLKKSDVKKQKIMLRLIKRLITTREDNASKIPSTNTQLFDTIRQIEITCPDEGMSNLAKEIHQVIRNLS